MFTKVWIFLSYFLQFCIPARLILEIQDVNERYGRFIVGNSPYVLEIPIIIIFFISLEDFRGEKLD